MHHIAINKVSKTTKMVIGCIKTGSVLKNADYINNEYTIISDSSAKK